MGILTDLIKQFASAREALERHAVRDTGDYAEVLVAEALKACRNTSGVTKGFDVLCATRGKIEARSRTLPRDGRNEDRLEIPRAKANGFALLAGVLFNSDLTVRGGFLLPHDDAISLSSRQKFLRIPFSVGAAHPNAQDITQLLRDAQARV